jgi:uncharacterized protein YndB with AHSA1/START domain
MIVVQTNVEIERSIDDVFAYVADVERLPEWNSAVTDVRQRARPAGEFVMRRELPSGRATNELQVTICEPPMRFEIATTSGPTPFHYAFSFSEDSGTTTVALHARADLGRVADLLGPVAGSALERGIRANLQALKQTLERTP